VDAYWAANIDLTDVIPELDIYDRAWPIWTHAEITPPPNSFTMREAGADRPVTSLVSGGCSYPAHRCAALLLFTGVHVNSYASMENAVVILMSMSAGMRD